MEELKIGDVVQLKSGSPEMTVFEVSGEKVRVAIYQDGEFKTSDSFFFAALFERTQRC